MWWTMVGCMRLTDNISGWPTYVILKGRKTNWSRWPFEIITICFLPVWFFPPKVKFSKFPGYKHSFCIDISIRLAGSLMYRALAWEQEASSAAKENLLLKKTITAAISSIQTFQPILGRKETCFPTTKNHCSLSNFSGIALWTSFTPFISSLCIMQQSKDAQFVPAGCSVKAWINGFYADESWGFKTRGPHSDLCSWRSGATLEHARAHVRAAGSAFPCLWHWGTRQTNLPAPAPASAASALCICLRGAGTHSPCANKGLIPMTLAAVLPSSKLPSERTS